MARCAASAPAYGLVAPRDGVGSLNIRGKGLHGEIIKVEPHQVPPIITYRGFPLCLAV